MDHVRAMSTVRTWQYTQRFGQLGEAQDSRSHSARVLEYFSDSYPDQREAIQKAELFLSIHDFIGRNSGVFAKKGLVDELGQGLLSVDPALLRSVNFAFLQRPKPDNINIKKVMSLARSFKELEQC